MDHIEDTNETRKGCRNCGRPAAYRGLCIACNANSGVTAEPVDILATIANCQGSELGHGLTMRTVHGCCCGWAREALAQAERNRAALGRERPEFPQGEFDNGLQWSIPAPLHFHRDGPGYNEPPDYTPEEG